jgi:hypothetical protein
MNKTELEFRIRINRDLVLLSAYGEPPTFAIWLENSQGLMENVYVTTGHMKMTIGKANRMCP